MTNPISAMRELALELRRETDPVDHATIFYLHKAATKIEALANRLEAESAEWCEKHKCDRNECRLGHSICVFCGEGIICEHGKCPTCQSICRQCAKET